MGLLFFGPLPFGALFAFSAWGSYSKLPGCSNLSPADMLDAFSYPTMGPLQMSCLFGVTRRSFLLVLVRGHVSWNTLVLFWRSCSRCCCRSRFSLAVFLVALCFLLLSFMPRGGGFVRAQRSTRDTFVCHMSSSGFNLLSVAGWILDRPDLFSMLISTGDRRGRLLS